MNNLLGEHIESVQWVLLALFGVGFFLVAPLSKTAKQFFAAEGKAGHQPKLWLLTSSLVISWIFAKSITNAADLGLAFGLVGGVAYATYYFSFVVAGIIIFKLRTKGGFSSIHHFLQSRFGRGAVVLFSVLVGFRLFNEVWSNTMVIGSYFGAIGSQPYYSSILLFTSLTLAYTLKGGLRSSFLTDAIQMVFFGVLLFLLLGIILPASEQPLQEMLTSGSWEMGQGLNLLFVALIQIFSYPFHDSVMTDRGFVSDAKTTLKAYLLAAAIGFILLVTFSLVGVYAMQQGLEKPAAEKVSKTLGVAAMLAMNLIMITSAASTLDSTFSSFSKLVVIDLGKLKKYSVARGRWVMVAITVLGTLPIFAEPEVLSATTVSGTMVIGLAPVFLFWHLHAPKASYFLSIGAGIIIGTLLALNAIPERLIFFEGKYGDLLSCNLWGSTLCFMLFFIPYWWQHGKREAI